MKTNLCKWKVLARHKWVNGCTITESHCDFKGKGLVFLRFTATINGFRNFKIYEGFAFENEAEVVVSRVKAIQSRIEAGDDEVFHENLEITKGAA